MPPPADTLSTLRRQLCNRDNALRVARRMNEDGVPAFVVAAADPLQPWRVIERDAVSRPETRARLTLMIALACATSACSAEAPTSGTPRAVTAKGRAIDGDTVSIDIRLLGADAFEKRQLCRTRSGCWPCGKASQDFTSRLLKKGNATIRLTSTQSYGRPVGTVAIDDEDLGETLIANGLAVPATQYLKGNPARARHYVAAYDKAAASHAGAHRGYFIDPAKWRHGERLSCEARKR